MPADAVATPPPPVAATGHEAAADIDGAALPTAWTGARRAALFALALVICMTAVAFASWLASTPRLSAQWGIDADGGIVLQRSPAPALQPLQGQPLRAIVGVDGTVIAAHGWLLQHPVRWLVDDAQRLQQRRAQQQLAHVLAAGPVRLRFASGAEVELQAGPRGYADLGLLFWPLTGVAMALALFAAVLVLARPKLRSGLYAVMATCQATSLLFVAVESSRGLGLPPVFTQLGLDLRLALDLFTAAAVVHAFTLHPVRLRHAVALQAAAWGLAVAGTLALGSDLLSPQWRWGHGLCLGLITLAWAVARHSNRIESNPFSLVMRRLSAITVATLVLLTAAVAASTGASGLASGVHAGAAVAWHLYIASLLLLMPFLARSRRLLRELTVLAGVATVAMSIDLLLAAFFTLGPLTSLSLALSIAVAVYAVARRVVGSDLLGRSLPATEIVFEQIYRAARDVQSRPERHPAVLTRLLGTLFDPLEMQQVERTLQRPRVLQGGAAMLVPLRRMDSAAEASDLALLLRFAYRGQRLFTVRDARLAERVAEQLRRAIAYDKAVERGRSEERMRIAQDLHDDIGARLLTLMYQAPTPELENYIRHTLQDLKTLTRGLAASEHWLSHACAEWKADLAQRMAAAQAELGWSVSMEQDRMLSVVQWSAMTRVLRELVSNALFHGRASRIDVRIQIDGPRLLLTVADDGDGRAPQAWSHGLGLGGVRKRVKLMHGEVTWRENHPRGIVCEVRVADFDATR